MKTSKHRKQYLDGLTPIYSGELQKMAEQGLVFVCECREEGCDPLPEGFATLEEASARAEELSAFADHAVYKLEQDEDGDWFTTFANLD
jgi:hypothetical protein